MKWNSDTKEVVAYCFAGLSLLFGFGLSIAGFIVDPTGQIHDSVLWVLAQALTFAGAICGVTFYVTNSIKNIKKNLSSTIKEVLQNERNAENKEED